MKDRLVNQVNWHHASMQATFWGGYCAIWSFITVFLLYRGFMNTQVGIITAVSTTIPTFIAPKLSALADKDPRFGVRRQAIFYTVLLEIAALFMWGFGQYKIVDTAVYLFIGILLVIVPSYFSVMVNDFAVRGLNVNFGLGRGMGSLCYGLCSLLLGFITERYSPVLILPVFVVLNALTLLSIVTFRYPLPSLPPAKAADVPVSNLALLKKYPSFALLVLGCGLMMGGHSTVCTYLIHVCERAGVGESAMGTMMAIGAVVEVPVMLLFNRFLRVKPLKFWLALSAFGFVLRQSLLAVATTPALLYVASFLQIIENSLYVPATTLYVVRYLDSANQAKGQALIYTMANGLGPAIALFLGGRLMDLYGVNALMVMIVAVSAVGAAIVLGALFMSFKKSGGEVS